MNHPASVLVYVPKGGVKFEHVPLCERHAIAKMKAMEMSDGVARFGSLAESAECAKCVEEVAEKEKAHKPTRFYSTDEGFGCFYICRNGIYFLKTVHTSTPKRNVEIACQHLNEWEALNAVAESAKILFERCDLVNRGVAESIELIGLNHAVREAVAALSKLRKEDE